MKAKTIVGKVLTAFLLVSIGVAIGREMSAPASPSAPAPGSSREKVVVYYLHGYPCVTCTFIETTAEKLMREEFADQVAAGTMEFVSRNYLEPENAALAEKYHVGENMVIAVRIQNGKEVANVRMDLVMQLASDPKGLADYLRAGIVSATAGGGQ